jgi:hypothetical protein
VLLLATQGVDVSRNRSVPLPVGVCCTSR